MSVIYVDAGSPVRGESFVTWRIAAALDGPYQPVRLLEVKDVRGDDSTLLAEMRALKLGLGWALRMSIAVIYCDNRSVVSVLRDPRPERAGRRRVVGEEAASVRRRMERGGVRVVLIPGKINLAHPYTRRGRDG